MTTGTRWRLALALLVFGTAVTLLFGAVAVKLVHDWATDGNYSHGFLILPLAAYFAWERRAALAAVPLKPHWAGAIGILAAIILHLAGILGAEIFLSRVAIVLLIASAVVFVLGWTHLAVLAFPVSFLLLMIPIPAIVFNQVALPLQMIAARFGQDILSALSVPVLREGNVIVLANTSLEVAEACSGIRSLVSLLTIALVCGYFIDPRAAVRGILAAASVPVAIVTNGLRVAATGVAAQQFGPEAATGFFHSLSGWLMFVPALLLLLGLAQLLRAFVPPSDGGTPHATRHA